MLRRSQESEFYRPITKARLTDGTVVEYDICRVGSVEPKHGWKSIYLGVGEIVEVDGESVDDGGRQLHFWRFIED